MLRGNDRAKHQKNLSGLCCEEGEDIAAKGAKAGGSCLPGRSSKLLGGFWGNKKYAFMSWGDRGDGGGG